MILRDGEIVIARDAQGRLNVANVAVAKAASAQPPPTDPRAVLQRTITYLSNNQSRMNYPEYRKQGLPVNSSVVESSRDSTGSRSPFVRIG